METQLNFNIDVPQLILEIGKNSNVGGALTIPLRVLQAKLVQIAKRGAELNDPQLNILLLETKLYEVGHDEVIQLIEQQRERLKS